MGCVQGSRRSSKKIVMVGLDGAGKTTVLYALKLKEKVLSVPTIGFNVETIQLDIISVTLWDVGGQHRLRQLWRHYLSATNGVMFVVDSADKERWSEVKTELVEILGTIQHMYN